MRKYIDFLYILGTISCTVCGLLMMKWRIARFGLLPDNFSGKITFLLRLMVDPFVFSGLVLGFIAAVFWMAAMTKFELSFAYPFVSLSYVLVLIFSAVLFKESITTYKIAGVVLILFGIFISSR